MPFPFSDGEILTGPNLNAAIEGSGVPEFLAFTPAGNTDGSGSPQANWVTMGNLTVPTWATSALVVIDCSGLQAITAVPSNWLMRARIGTTGPLSGGNNIAFDALSDRRSGTVIGLVSAPGTGSQSLVINIERRAGTGSLRADTESRFAAIINYRG